MNEVLTQDEIDQLLQAISGEDNEDFKPVKDTRRIKIYDMMRPDVLSKEDIRLMYMVMEEIFPKLMKVWKKIFPNLENAHLTSIDQLTFEEFIRCSPIPTVIGLGMIGQFPIAVNLGNHLNTYLGDEVMEHINDNDKCKKAIEKGIVKPIIYSFTELFFRKKLSSFIQKPANYKFETNPMFVNGNYERYYKPKTSQTYFSPSEMVALLTIECKGNPEAIEFCIPWKLVKKAIKLYNGEIDNKETFFSKEFFKDIKVPVNVSIGSKMISIEDLIGMGEGTILELNKLAGEPVDILAGDKKVAEGEIVVIEENFGVRVTSCLQN